MANNPFTGEKRGDMTIPVCWIHPDQVEERLFLGSRFAASRHAPYTGYDSVLTVSREERPLTTVHRPICDGAFSTDAQFAAAVDAARNRYRTNESLLVHCAAGVSRSVAVVATTLTAERRYHSFEQALERIREVRPVASPNRSIIEHAEQYLGDPIDGGRLRGTTIRLRLIRIAQALNRWRLRLRDS